MQFYFGRVGGGQTYHHEAQHNFLSPIPLLHQTTSLYGPLIILKAWFSFFESYTWLFLSVESLLHLQGPPQMSDLLSSLPKHLETEISVLTFPVFS